MLDVVLTLEMLEQLWPGLELAGATHHMAGEAVRLELVGLQRLQAGEPCSTIAAENSFRLRVGSLVGVTPGGVAGPVEYTLRTGLRPGSVEADGTLLEEAASAGSGRSCLLWDTPELRLSLDSLGWAARLLPQIWVPVAAACCVVLPRGATLRRAVVSEAGDGVSASGEFALAREADVYALAVR